MTLSIGSVILLPFPFSDLDTAKIRPALILYMEKHNSDVIVAPITSQKRKDAIPIFPEHLEKGVIAHRSYVRFKKLMSLDKQLILRRVGITKTEYINTILQNVANLFPRIE